ncbi:MAG: sigma-54 dependent transcriptional regulator [Oligoflexia bacterium]|nr:sigma-54 dependent transcriptional regulator [Oligoflexia bacterium]
MAEAPEKDRILIIDDDEQLADIMSVMLDAEGYEVIACSNGGDGLLSLASEAFALVLLDLRLAGGECGLDLVPRIREIDPNVPVLMITAHGDVDSAVLAFKAGVVGYVRKPFEEGHLKSQVAQAVENFRLKRELRSFRQLGGEKDVRKIFRSRDPAMEVVLKRIAVAAQVSSSAVITGESGTGKELAARALHFGGPRGTGPFIAFNCAALPETLIESELFGHVRGAFTDARENKPGLFVRANGGTLFIDEIGDAPLTIQSKLLRALQEREVQPLGAQAPVKVDVRIVAATHRSLASEVAAGRFRQDLFYRLQVIPIHLPPLRERKRDIHFLASFFASKISREMELPFEGFSPGAVDALEGHSWPGNVRELQNRVEYALVIGRGGWISRSALFPELASETPEAPEVSDTSAAAVPAEASSEPGDAGLLPFKEAKHSFEKSYLLRILSEAKGNIAKAARLAVKSRTELYGLVKKHGLDPENFKDQARV